MNKARNILLICTLTAAAWSFPGLALAKNSAPLSWKTASAFDGHSPYSGNSAFDGH
jgi:hypothetical protein